jgi:phage gpG-like protein
MPVDFRVTIDIPDRLRQRLDPVVFQGATVKAMQRAVLGVIRRAKLNLTGRFLRVQTGRLRSSVTSRVMIAGPEVVGIIGTNVFYGRIHEEGVSHSWTIRSKRAGGVLKFTAGGKTIFARQVQHPPLPARPWLRTAAVESRADIIAAFQSELDKALSA